MISPSGKDTFKAMRLVRESESWQYVRAWLEAALEDNRTSIRNTVDPYAVNRLEGEREAILTVMEEFDASPANEVAAANDSPRPGHALMNYC